MRRSLPTGISYTIAITNEKVYPLIKKIVEKKERDLEFKFESKPEAKSFINQSRFFIFQNHDVDLESGFLKCVFNKNNPYESSINTLGLIKFLMDFKINEDVNDLEIIVGENDVEGFRLASFIASYLETKNKKVTIKDSKQNTIPLLYGPHIQEASLKVLYSAIDYRLKNGKFPNFNELKNHHFGITKKFAEEEIMAEIKTKKNRIWNSAGDNKFVSSLYAAQRNLETSGLITKQKDPKVHVITGIVPTLNGFLSMIFSDVGEKLISNYSAEDIFEDTTD